jgi:phosphoglycerate dehydrogenase-like enzyme
MAQIIASPRVRKEYGARIRAADPAARFIVPSARDGALAWDGDPAKAEVCCLSADMWEDLESRQLVLPALFRLDQLRWFHSFSAGVDSPAFKVILDRGTLLTNSSGASAPSIAQYVISMMLYRSKPFDAWREQQSRHEWKPALGRDLTGQTSGIIGTGAIGGEVARLAKAMGMRTIGMRRSGKPARHIDEMVTARKLRYLLRESDFVVLACPLTKETEGLLGAAQLAVMKPTATLINVARGRIVDEAALIDALEAGTIAGACLDVFTVEPLPETSPLWSMPNVVVTPHNSGVSPLNMERAMGIFIDNLGRFVAGRPLRNRVLEAGR